VFKGQIDAIDDVPIVADDERVVSVHCLACPTKQSAGDFLPTMAMRRTLSRPDLAVRSQILRKLPVLQCEPLVFPARSLIGRQIGNQRALQCATFEQLNLPVEIQHGLLPRPGGGASAAAFDIEE
jgi:hypothetical protein